MLLRGLACCDQSCPFPRWFAYDIGSVWSKAYRWEWRKDTPDGWRLSAIIAYGVIMHWAIGQGSWDGVVFVMSWVAQHEMTIFLFNSNFLPLVFFFFFLLVWFLAVRFPYRRQARRNASSRGRWNQGVAARWIDLVSSACMLIAHTWEVDALIFLPSRSLFAGKRW